MGAAIYLAICILMWGMAMFVMKVVGARLDPLTIAAFNMFGYLSVGVFLFPKASYGFSRYHLLSILIGAMFVIANMAFYKLSQTGQVSVLAPLTALYVVVPVILGIAFLHEPPSLRKLAGVVLALVALYLLSGVEAKS